MQTACTRVERVVALARVEHRELVLGRRVADADAQEEAVELRLGERVGALVVDGVLRREDEERLRAAGA